MPTNAPEQDMSPVTFDDYVPSGTAAPSPKQEAQTPTFEEPVVVAPEPEPAVVAKDAPAQEEPVASTPKPTEAEVKARATGWRPLNEFTGDPRKWVPAEVWAANQPLVDQVRSHKRQVRDLQRSVATMAEHHKKVHELAYKQAYETLQAQRDQAVLNQDVQLVRQYDEKIQQTRDEEIRTKPQVPTTVDPAALQWANEHPEVMNDPTLRAEAVLFDNMLMQTQPEMEIEDRLEKVEQRLHVLYPEKFRNQRRERPAQVDVGAPATNGNGNRRHLSVADLTPEEQSVHNLLVRTGAMTSADYLKDLESFPEPTGRRGR